VVVEEVAVLVVLVRRHRHAVRVFVFMRPQEHPELNTPAEVATPKAKAKGTKRPRCPAAAQAALEGEVYEEDGVDWKVLAVVWDADEEEVVVWYYDAEMAADGDLSEDEMDLSRTEGLDLGPLECSSVTEVKGWIRPARSGLWKPKSHLRRAMWGCN